MPGAHHPTRDQRRDLHQRAMRSRRCPPAPSAQALPRAREAAARSLRELRPEGHRESFGHRHAPPPRGVEHLQVGRQCIVEPPRRPRSLSHVHKLAIHEEVVQRRALDPGGWGDRRLLERVETESLLGKPCSPPPYTSCCGRVAVPSWRPASAAGLAGPRGAAPSLRAVARPCSGPLRPTASAGPTRRSEALT